MQLMAMLTMIIDHIGIVFFPGDQAWRIVGRIAFPLYAYGIVQGYIHTSNRSRYIQRLLWLSAASQIPYLIVMDVLQINVIGTFVVCLVVLFALDRIRNNHFKVSFVFAAIAFLEVLPFDYGPYALLLVLIYRYRPRSSWILYHTALNIASWLLLGWGLQLYSIIPTLFLVYGPQLGQRIAVPRWIWRSFYPAHLAVLAFIVTIERV